MLTRSGRRPRSAEWCKKSCWPSRSLLTPPQLHLRVRKYGFAALADEPWVTGSPTSGLGIALQRAADAAGFAPKVKHRVESAQNICQLATTEVASAVVPRMAVPAQFESLIVQGIDFGVREISAVVREGRRETQHQAGHARTAQHR